MRRSRPCQNSTRSCATRKPPQCRGGARRARRARPRARPAALEARPGRRPPGSGARPAPRSGCPGAGSPSRRRTPRRRAGRPAPSTMTWRPSGCHGNSSAARGLAASSRPLRLSWLVKNTKPSSSSARSSTVRTDGPAVGRGGGDHHGVGVAHRHLVPGREPAPELLDRVGGQVGLVEAGVGVLLAQLGQLGEVHALGSNANWRSTAPLPAVRDARRARGQSPKPWSASQSVGDVLGVLACRRRSACSSR